METSILESIGTEILSVMTPVSICMLLVVLLVYTISTPTSSLSSVHTAATLVYLETPTDSTTQKLEGALLNAVVFILLVAALTFLLLLLYYYNYTNFLKHYMRFSAFFVLGSMGGSIFLSIIQHFSIPIDSITCYILLLNFTIVGVLSVFSSGIPIVFRQGYMIVLGIIVAAWFTKLPEWTTWVLLVALAVYDLFAVLCPGGPLKLLVELASSRDEDLPALIYEARPTMGAEDRRGSLGILVGGAMMAKGPRSIELQQIMHNNEGEDEETSPLVANSGQWTSTSSGSSEYSTVTTLRSRQHGNTESEIVGEISPLVDIISSGNETEQHVRRDDDIGEEYEISMHPGIKLGLGDFVFYSVLVGRAAMYDLMTVYACYIAIISGLGCTLILLSVCRQALPALPISILLGVIFYFLTRLLMEPFIVGLSTNLIMF